MASVTERISSGCLSLAVASCLVAHLAWVGCSRDGDNPEESPPSSPQPVPSHGLALLQDLRLLPVVPEKTVTRQVSSHSRDGGNTDFGNYGDPSGRETYLYKEEGMKVLLDEQGPGCINRMWITTPFIGTIGPIQIFLDRMDEPVVDMSADDLFSGEVPPFLFPLAGSREVSSGGYYCYVPMPFRERCKIRVGGALLYYNIDYYRFTDAEGIETFTVEEPISEALDLLGSSGSNPHRPSEELWTKEGTFVLGPGEEETIFYEQGPAWILVLKLWPHSLSEPDLSSLWLYALWDGAIEPQVAAPLPEFFGSGLGPESVKAFPVGMDPPENLLYCYFPMPFDKEGQVWLQNRGYERTDFRYEVHWSGRPAWASPGRTGAFHARWNEENPTRPNRDYRILQANGWGRFVGCTLTMYGAQTGTSSQSYLEGDERVYTDDSLSPCLYGTGAEDYFNGGWYFMFGTFALPYHGNPGYRKEAGGRVSTGCYRFHVTDPIPFYRNLLVGMEHGGFNEYEARYTSVAFYYARPEPALILTDSLDVGDERSESLHRYEADGVAWTGEATFHYEGDRDGTLGGLLPVIGPPVSLPPPMSPESVRDDGRWIRSGSRFVVRLDPENRGVRIRRRLDAGKKDQKANVWVDGLLMSAPWLTLGWNTAKRWKDAEYEIPARYTAGKEAMTLSIEVEGGDQNPWTEYTYWIYCYGNR